MSDIKLNTPTSFLILRILSFIKTKSLKEEEEGFEHVLEKGFTEYLERDFGKDRVIIIKISIIKCLFYIYALNLLFFLDTYHERRRRNLP